ncbi:MAG: haloalkane dehalogenase [Rhodospirillaceae bacterium]|jgi:haloalkane dehalogenase|nr:haloalkane dehalogenase [Rhodospirillaceae bacterium]MBT5240614.1 haloalkane dehalogenase [Rhodospirillaceae bacterium]MBT5564448.1 haloalkane dehalogenase [Rhodospirillaceae bacterium]MBT6089739.1 haloalkane dehalogenase [Rhodospirillaceae bacterium]MBT6961937.1 haloalkane dehalogenase [Rhodospirillaceae bacterium]
MTDFTDVQFTDVKDQRMAWRETGEGDPIIFVHGNPTSSYLWRNVVPELSSIGRCIAPDLIGMGQSDKLPDHGARTYSYFVHRDYFDGWMDAMSLSGPITFVGHNWGVPLFFDWAMRNPDKTRGFVHMEGQVSPVTTAIAGDRFQAFNAHMRSPEMEADVLNDNLYLEQYFFRYVDDLLSDQDKAEYEQPYMNPGPDRRPTIDWPCEIPVDGEPSDVFGRLNELIEWMKINDIPKLWLVPDTASIMTGERKTAAESFSHQTTLQIEGEHYTPETSPDIIGRAIANWIEGLGV